MTPSLSSIDLLEQLMALGASYILDYQFITQ